MIFEHFWCATNEDVLLNKVYYIKGLLFNFQLFCGATEPDMLLTEFWSCSGLYGIDHRTEMIRGESSDTSLNVVSRLSM